MVEKFQMEGPYTAEKDNLQKLYTLIMGSNAAETTKKMKLAIYKMGLVVTASLIILAFLLL